MKMNTVIVGLMDMEKSKLLDLIREYKFSKYDLELILAVVLFKSRIVDDTDYKTLLSNLHTVLKENEKENDEIRHSSVN